MPIAATIAAPIRPLTSLLASITIVVSLSTTTLASETPQADPARSAERRAGEDGRGDGTGARLGSWEMPPLVVQGQAPAATREEDQIGSEAQPRWTARRRFAETRVYTVPDGLVEFEGWYTVERERHGQPQAEELIYELEMGLPYRCQIDVFQVQHKDARDGSLDDDESGLELDHALAPWGRIVGNPTLHGEFAVVGSGYDRIEAGILLGDELCSRVYWGSNLRFERATGGDRERSFEATLAVGYALDDRVSLGAEGKAGWEDTAADRGHFENDALFGPSVQLRPSGRVHVDADVLFGLNDDSPTQKYVVIAGCEF